MTSPTRKSVRTVKQDQQANELRVRLTLTTCPCREVHSQCRSIRQPLASIHLLINNSFVVHESFKSQNLQVSSIFLKEGINGQSAPERCRQLSGGLLPISLLGQVIQARTNPFECCKQKNILLEQIQICDKYVR